MRRAWCYLLNTPPWAAAERDAIHVSMRTQAQAQAEAEDEDFNPEKPESGAPEAGSEEV